MSRPTLPGIAAALLLSACAAPLPDAPAAPAQAARQPSRIVAPEGPAEMRAMDLTPVAYGAALLLF